MTIRRIFSATASLAVFASMSWAAGDTSAAEPAVTASASAPAAPVQPKDHKNLCFMDGKANSIGARVSADGKAYRCSAVLLERGVRGVAWVAVREASVIAE
jgi:hypothetical protein